MMIGLSDAFPHLQRLAKPFTHHLRHICSPSTPLIDLMAEIDPKAAIRWALLPSQVDPDRFKTYLAGTNLE